MPVLNEVWRDAVKCATDRVRQLDGARDTVVIRADQITVPSGMTPFFGTITMPSRIT
jgi:hypothetical protein